MEKQESKHVIQINLKNSISLKEEENSQNSEEDENDKLNLKKERKPRRSKEFIEGRNYVCLLCKKAYLSRPALHNHQKTKHEFEEFKSLPISCIESNQFNVPMKKRGRPKKNQKYQVQIENFFNEPKRKKVNDCGIIIDNENNNPFIEFLNYVAPLTNSNFFGFTRTVIFMLSDFERKVNSGREVDKEHLPDLVNNFFRFVREKNIYKTNEEKFEMIELIYVFCLWLQEKSYTTARLEYHKYSKDK